MKTLARHWSLLATRGIVAVTFMVVLAAWAGMPLESLWVAFALFAALDGTLTMLEAVAPEPSGPFQPLLMSGALSVVAVCAVVLWHDDKITVEYVVAGWAILTGLAELWAAAALRREMPGELTIGASGVVALLLGLGLGALARVGVESVRIPLAFYLLVSGFAELRLAQRLVPDESTAQPS
jgi:uncharacterized membrane protein HdeD (DUF308 family)